MRRGDAGSVLVESLVAIAIIAMVLVAGYRAVGESALRARAAEAARTATLVARSRLDAAGVETALSPGTTEGVDGAFAWRVAVEDAAAAPSVTGRLLRVTVVVRDRDGGGPRATLTTLRLAPEG